MIRLLADHAAITAPFVSSSARFPGIPIGRSSSDGRPFNLSPVQVKYEILPSTNSLTLGEIGSGKSTSRKVQIRREVKLNQHQVVVIDSFGEQKPAGATEGEWAPLTRDLNGQIIKAGEFTLNPCSPLFPPDVREQLVRSLISTVEPTALTPQASHALQHALNHPKASNLGGLVDALQAPEDGRYPADKLTAWGEGAVLALTNYTDGALRGLFDGPSAGLPDTDVPIISFDFTQLDKTSPAIPALMAAISCWVEHVWLKQSTARHRHFVIEEAWQIFLSPHTAQLIQKLIKNSRKVGLSVDAVMHTLSDLGDGRALDLARLATIIQIGRLTPDEAAQVGALYELPAWAVEKIPTLTTGEAVWKVGPAFVDVIQTIISEEEAKLTDTSNLRRAAQAAALLADPDEQQDTETEGEDTAVLLSKDTASPFAETEEYDYECDGADDGPYFALPPGVIDTVDPRSCDDRHDAVLQAARAGRFGEAADIAVVGERADITAYGMDSPQATAWLVTRAEMAELSGDPARAAHLRATVARMGNDDGAAWFENTDNSATQWHQVPDDPATPDLTGEVDDEPRSSTRRRMWPYAAAIAVLTLTAGGVWQNADRDHKQAERQQKADNYKGRSGANLNMDSVDADVVARWTRDRDSVIVELRASFEPNAKYLRIESDGKKAVSQPDEGRFAQSPEIVIPVDDPYADVTVDVAIGGKGWKEGSRAASREIRLSPAGTAYDAETDERLPSDL